MCALHAAFPSLICAFVCVYEKGNDGLAKIKSMPIRKAPYCENICFYIHITHRKKDLAVRLKTTTTCYGFSAVLPLVASHIVEKTQHKGIVFFGAVVCIFACILLFAIICTHGLSKKYNEIPG